MTKWDNWTDPEVLNALSSLPSVVSGLWLGIGPQSGNTPWRVRGCALGWAVCGVASFVFHSTHNYLAHMADRVCVLAYPIFAALLLNFATTGPQALLFSVLALGIIPAAIAGWHVQACSFGAVLVNLPLWRLAWAQRHRLAYRLYLEGCVVWMFAGICFVLGHRLEQKGMTEADIWWLHTLWHVLSAFAMHSLLVFLHFSLTHPAKARIRFSPLLHVPLPDWR
eukprot:TRINITY_DN9239_c0_g1_i1.p1 TRINITY_DN9239_c0_g1~~TRINITY_DN9239_c0_g1_i1.p1  ORF type:complete len:223 (+),score=24.87 TRINITY_DN9239_c0_g1_i1:826-1494(+)